jgi:hypothetical protein
MNAVRLIAVLLLEGGAPAMLERGDAMEQRFATSAFFLSPAPTPNPTPAAFKADLDALRAAQALKGNGPAAVAARNVALKQVKRDFENLRIYTQQCADSNESEAAAIIAAAGMYVKKVAVRVKPDFAVVQGATTGSAIARAKSRGRGVTYWWEVSTDQKTWQGSLPTRKATGTFANLTPGTLYYFRFQVLTKAGMSDWSQVIAFMPK